ncbi:MAG TPA: hypothetical protein PKL54_08195, partial [Candidatus Hydrogenedentes bacterium]|nr:hypothetical protein [Candidatus Hydrogenedentota bacterium]
MARKPETWCILQAGTGGVSWWRFGLSPAGTSVPLASGALRGDFHEDDTLSAALKSLADER